MSKNPRSDALIRFLNDSPTPYHAVEASQRFLLDAGGNLLLEGLTWSLRPGQLVFITRGNGSLIAVRIPEPFDPNKPLPFHIAAAHTDSPGLRLKPRPIQTFHQYRQWGAEIYGGILFNSWLDRDLGIAGRVTNIGSGSWQTKLIRLEDHPVRIPQLAIHLDRKVNEDGLILNPQKHLIPVLGQTGQGGLSFESMIETAAGVPFTDMTFDLCLYDKTPACYGGTGDEFIYSGRLDNLAMSHAALTAFIEAESGDAIQMMALFDHEEVGSVSPQGAESNFLSVTLERIGIALGMSRETWLSSLSQSFLISADMAHAIHPNYPDKHEPEHFPLLNAGPVLKSNAGLKYASDGLSAARFLGYAQRAGVPVQRFLSRNDLGCGTTVGPGLGAQLGIPTVDVGTPMLSMHSAREMCGTEDHGQMIAVLKEFFRG